MEYKLTKESKHGLLDMLEDMQNNSPTQYWMPMISRSTWERVWKEHQQTLPIKPKGFKIKQHGNPHQKTGRNAFRGI
jgi:hypothetical protein